MMFVLLGKGVEINENKYQSQIMLEDSPTNELIVGEGMCHIYPLFPIPEARDAFEIIAGKIVR